MADPADVRAARVVVRVGMPSATPGLKAESWLLCIEPESREDTPMRPADIELLSQRCPDGTVRSTTTRLLGVQTPNWEALERSIFDDFVTEWPYGIGWWAPHPGTSRRILISDQLHACSTSVSTNLIEAGVHWLELLGAVDREDSFQADAIRIVHGEPQVFPPPRLTPLESLGPDMVRLHEVGVARALSGALDCAAGTIIGVMALPLSILKAGFVGVQRHFERRETGTTEGERRQEQFANHLTETIASVGPAGWLDWVLNFRNMLVHRGRRIEFGQFVRRDPVLVDPSGRPVPRSRVVTHLPLDPDRSDMDVHREPDLPPVLTEDVRQTLEGSMRSVCALVEALGEQLAAEWEWRKEHPGTLTQPRAQWPRVSDPARPNPQPLFEGYAPGSHAYRPGVFIAHHDTGRRLLAAALMDHQRHEWRAFD